MRIRTLDEARADRTALAPPVRIILRDPVGMVIADFITRVGVSLNVGGGVLSNMVAVGWIDVLAPDAPVPAAPFLPGNASSCDYRNDPFPPCQHDHGHAEDDQ